MDVCPPWFMRSQESQSLILTISECVYVCMCVCVCVYVTETDGEAGRKHTCRSLSRNTLMGYQTGRITVPSDHSLISGSLSEPVTNIKEAILISFPRSSWSSSLS